MTRYDFQRLARTRLEDARILLRNARYEDCFYLSGYVVECALKACISRLTKRYDFPDRELLHGVYTHDLTQLLRIAKLEAARDAEMLRDSQFSANWYIVQCCCRSQALGAPMDKTVLVGPDIDEGRTFLELLSKSGIEVNAALWQRDSLGRWDLIIVAPLVKKLGLKETYRRLIEILARAEDRPGVDLLNVTLLGPDERFSKSFRRELRRARELPISQRPVGDSMVEEGFVYFVK